jgi:hypothetical protein
MTLDVQGAHISNVSGGAHISDVSGGAGVDISNVSGGAHQEQQKVARSSIILYKQKI